MNLIWDTRFEIRDAGYRMRYLVSPFSHRVLTRISYLVSRISYPVSRFSSPSGPPLHTRMYSRARLPVS